MFHFPFTILIDLIVCSFQSTTTKVKSVGKKGERITKRATEWIDKKAQRAADAEKTSERTFGICSYSVDVETQLYKMTDILGKYNNCEGIVIETRFVCRPSA